jgi:DNA polymerase-3 subunit epsilon
MQTTSSQSDKIIKYLPGITNYNSGKIGTNKGVIVDTEATDKDPKSATLIELTMLPFTFTDEMEICEIKKPVTLLNDPGGPLSDEVKKLTGLTDKMLRGHSLDYELIIDTMNDNEITLAHNAKFDRTILERHVAIPDYIWGCTMYDIDYEAKLINSRAQDYIAFRNGFWYEGHRSEEDCRALAHILNSKFNGVSYFQELMLKVYESTFKIILRDTEFNDNSLMKKFKFKWDGVEKYWFRPFTTEAEGEQIREELFPKLTKYSATKVVEDINKRYKG